MRPIELIGRTPFPPIGDLPYLLTLGPHTFYWFSIEHPRAKTGDVKVTSYQVPSVEFGGSWDTMLRSQRRGQLESILSQYVPGCRWFGSKTRTIKKVRLTEALPISEASDKAYLTMIDLEFGTGDPESYALPLAFEVGDRAVETRQRSPERIIAELKVSNGDG